jgi:hypothetical protein
MFDFLKPEVSGLKNVLNAYFAFKQQFSIIGDVPPERMNEFAHWYYAIRLGPPMIPAHKAHQMQTTALSTVEQCLASGRCPNVTLVDVLFGLLAAEGMTGRSPNSVALGRMFDKFLSISPEIRGL